MRKRLFYLDLVRALAVVLIVITHFNYPYLAGGHYILTMEPFGIYIGNLGVSLFLIISGAALMYSYRGKVDLRRFYWKRFKSIYPMFWIAWVIATSYFVLTNNGSPLNTAPARSILFTILGVDGLAATLGFRTFYLLGEWFLGFIIIFYIVFPLLRWGVATYPKITATIVILIYCGTIYFFLEPRTFPASVILTTRLPELAFGMYFVRYIKKAPFWLLIPALGILLLSGINPGLNEDVATTVVGIAAFIVLVITANLFDYQVVREPVALISKYSYAIFLVHHVVIMVVFQMVDAGGLSRARAHLVFGATSLVIFGLAFALHHLNDNVIAFVTRMFAGVRIGRKRSTKVELSSPTHSATG